MRATTARRRRSGRARVDELLHADGGAPLWIQTTTGFVVTTEN